MMDRMADATKLANVADLIVARLRDAGVRCLFGMPGGGSNLDLIEAAGDAGLPFVLASTETAGALAAAAQAEVTGRPGACLTTLGPGAASVVNGVASAFLDRVPLIVFTDSHPASAVFAHQRLDQHALLAPVTKWSAVLTPENAARTIDEAIDVAMTPPEGPVHLECPGHFGSRIVDCGSSSRSPDVQSAVPPSPSALVDLLSRARKPLLLVGLGARRCADAAAIQAFCGRCGVPAMVTYKAKGVVPDHHPQFAGVFTNALIEQPLLAESDLLIGVGLDPVELIPRPWKLEQPIISCGRWRVDDRHVPFAFQLVTDVADAVQLIEERLPASDWDPVRIRGAVEEQRRSMSAPAGALTAQRVVQVAAGRLAPNSRVTVDAGAHMFPATILWPVSSPTDMLISNGLSTMGFALPAAVGAALVDRDRRDRRDRPVVALTGDGGLLMCAAELLTAAREALPIIVIVFSDGSLSLIEVKQQQRQHRRAGVALGSVDWPALAASFGVTAARASSETELVRCVEQAIDASASGPCLIEARIDASSYGGMLRAVRGA
jgi:acetolactate synthase-1/2/3 large subunit